MHAPRTPRRRRTVIRGVTVLLAAAGILTPASAWAQTAPPGDPGLNQTIDADDPIVHGDHVIATGHVDLGPKFDDGTWTLLIHDDAARANKDAQSVWRHPGETVLQVLDAAQLTVPESDTYSFVGADPGATVWVVPQTQNPDVVWTGWNTQDPTVMQRIDRGATFSVDGVEGPGVLTVYLQAGDFGAPQVLWDSRATGPQDVFVDTNTHTHANWVFTQPGVYLVRMTVAATLTDGSQVSDTQLLRFAVGSATSTDEALTAAWAGSAAAESAQPSSAPAAAPPGQDQDDQGPLVAILVVAIVVVAAGLVVGFAIAIARSGRAKRRVLAARTAAAPAADDGSGA